MKISEFIIFPIALLLPFFLSINAGHFSDNFSDLRRRSPPNNSLCAQLLHPAGYPCTEHTIQTEDGFVLALQRVASHNRKSRVPRGPPVLLLHGLFMAGDAWFLDSVEQSLGFILADQGFDVWVGNVRGTRWSQGHTSLSVKDKKYWDWSWQELAMYDLAEMIRYVNLVATTKVFLVGHSQGTIMSLAALTQPHIAEMIEAAALLSPISYLGHISAPLVQRMVSTHLDQMVVALGIHQLDFRSEVLVNLVDSLCDGYADCNDFLTSITGKNCCFNNSRVDFYLEYEPHPSSTKNLRHLFQMMRKDTFAQYDYGILKNVFQYGQFKPPSFDLSRIPSTIPLWMSYGGKDALADVIDVQHTIKELPSKTELLYLDNYGHIDFLLSVKARQDIYTHIVGFFRLMGKSSSF